ncbi:MAG TPA: anti-virulence regulator CigR family protein [Gemmatimonadales bacterium]|jgi:hypothetical protein|nr:anti-virulence regulator CigR family protein [Gemmatimonadales bacterium]
MHARLLIITAALLCTAGQVATAQERDHDKNAPNNAPTVSVVFTAAERNSIVAYYRAHRNDLKALPPGIARNLSRGKPLPPGIAKKHPPQEVTRRLVVRPGYETLVVGNVVVLVNPRGIVSDILSGIF